MATTHTNLRNLSFFDIRKIAKEVSGKKATGDNLIKSGAQERMKTYNLASIYVARAIGLACASRGTSAMLDKLYSELGEETMRNLTLSTSVAEMLSLVAKTSVDTNDFTMFLTLLCIRNDEVESLAKSQKESESATV